MVYLLCDSTCTVLVHYHLPVRNLQLWYLFHFHPEAFLKHLVAACYINRGAALHLSSFHSDHRLSDLPDYSLKLACSCSPCIAAQTIGLLIKRHGETSGPVQPSSLSALYSTLAEGRVSISRDALCPDAV